MLESSGVEYHLVAWREHCSEFDSMESLEMENSILEIATKGFADWSRLSSLAEHIVLQHLTKQYSKNLDEIR